MPAIQSDQNSNFVAHEACPSCQSSDNLARYDDGHGFCFGCGYYEGTDGEATAPTSSPSGLLPMDFRSLSKRQLTEETCRKFGYGLSHWKGQTVQVAGYHDDEGSLIAQKIRTRSKDFSILGEGRNLGLWGKRLWGQGGKRIVITEGELDAMSVSQAQNNRWPVVSVPSGAQGASKCVRRDLEWLETYEVVVFMFDQDEPGQKAAVECAMQLSPGKAAIASLPLKDANEMLVAGRSKELITSLWEAKPYRPDGVVPGEELWERIIEENDLEAVEYPWSGLNVKTYGMRQGEVVTLSSGTGQGKSLAIREMELWLIEKGYTVGVVALEENVKQSAQNLMGLQLHCPPHRWKEAGITEEQKREAFEATVGSGRCVLYDHWGSLDSDNLLSRIRYMARGMGCTHIFLDHLSIVVSGIGEGDERRLLDNTMTKLRSLVEELNISLIIVSHLKRPEGRSHEEGGQVSLAHLRGSGSIAQLSDICIGLERDQQDSDSKHTTTIRVLKNRYTGDTGVACSVRYNPLTGRLSEWDGDDVADVPF